MIRDYRLKYTVDIIGILLGTTLCGFGFSFFLIPFKSSPGGVGGISQLFFYLFNIPAGISMLIVNIPLFIIGILIFGKSFGIKTIIGMLSLSFFTDLFVSAEFVNKPYLRAFIFQINDLSVSFTDQILLAVLAGSTIVGIGFGLVLKFNGSTGGTDIPALIMKKYLGISIGNSYLIIDTFIITLTGIVFQDPNLIIWGILSLFISSKICDFVLEGFSYDKGVLITSKFAGKIYESISNTMNINSTVLNHQEYSLKNHTDEIIYLSINRKEISNLKQIIHNADNNARISIFNIHKTG